jgi:hypothetical protein
MNLQRGFVFQSLEISETDESLFISPELLGDQWPVFVGNSHSIMLPSSNRRFIPGSLINGETDKPAVKLPSIDIRVIQVSGKLRSGNRYFQREDQRQFENLHFLDRDAVDLGKKLGGKQAAVLNLFETPLVLKNNVEGQFEGTRILAAN